MILLLQHVPEFDAWQLVLKDRRVDVLESRAQDSDMLGACAYGVVLCYSSLIGIPTMVPSVPIDDEIAAWVYDTSDHDQILAHAFGVARHLGLELDLSIRDEDAFIEKRCQGCGECVALYCQLCAPSRTAECRRLPRPTNDGKPPSSGDWIRNDSCL